MILIGHLTFCGLVRRPSLCVFHTVYKFIHRRYGDSGGRPCGSGSEMNFKLFRGFYSCWCKIGGGPGIVWFQVQMPVWEDMAYAIHGGSKDRGYVWPSS